MIKGVHAMFYSNQADELRAFIRDKLRLSYTDVGEGWLIFDLPEGDLGVHPTEGGDSGTHNVSFYCDDVQATVAELKSRGVTFDMEIEDHGYGLVTHFTMPGGVKVQLYQPRYRKNKPKPAKAAAKAKSARKAKARPQPKAKAKAKPSAKAKPKAKAKKSAARPKKAAKKRR